MYTDLDCANLNSLPNVSVCLKVSLNISEKNMSGYATTSIIGQVLSSECPSRQILEHLTSKWSVLILRCLSDGVQRFSQLRNRIDGISEKMLAQTLKILEKDGFILRTVYPEVPPKVEYQLTILGAQAAEKINYLIGWIEKSLPEIMENKALVKT